MGFGRTLADYRRNRSSAIPFSWSGVDRVVVLGTLGIRAYILDLFPAEQIIFRYPVLVSRDPIPLDIRFLRLQCLGRCLLRPRFNPDPVAV